MRRPVSDDAASSRYSSSRDRAVGEALRIEAPGSRMTRSMSAASCASGQIDAVDPELLEPVAPLLELKEILARHEAEGARRP